MTDKHNMATHKIVGRDAFRAFQRPVSKIGMKFSSKHNAIYSSYSAAALIGTMCKHGMCAEQASEMLRAAEEERKK